ncbi:hypothetical protein LUCX_180 [Xanthomonas phage vB_XciM_LucasX]|nr:hypothetical protein LUCX_180 [Xanthomonas phage vB_XciM_LucasX]
MGQLFKRLLGIIHVEQKNDLIQIGGVATDSLSRDIQNHWGTSKIVANMFAQFGRRLIEFQLFFALEVHYMLQQLLKNRRNWTSKSAIQSAIKQLEDNTWLANLKPDVEHPKVLDRSRLKLFFKTPLPHQLDFFNLYEYGRTALGLKGYLLSAAAGSGKTLMDLMLAEMVHSDFVVIVSPNNAVYRVWHEAIAGNSKREYREPQSIWIAGEDKPYKGERFLLTHYEGMARLLVEARKLNGKVTVILDESHNFNEIKSQRTQLFIELCEITKSENVIWASGTPIKALGGECIPLLKTIDPLFDAKAEARFRQIFGINAQRALDILKNRMGFITFKVEKTAVVDNKPTERTIRVKIPNGGDYTLDAVRQRMTAFISERTAYYKKNYKTYEDIYEGCLSHFEATLKDSKDKASFGEYRRQVAVVKRTPDPRFTGDQMKFCNQYEEKVIMPTLSLADRKAFKGAKSVIKYVNLKVMGEALGSVLGKARSQVHVDMLPHIPFDKIMEEAEKKTVIFTSYVEVVKQLDAQLRKGGHTPMLVYGETNKHLVSNVGAFEDDASVNPLVATYPSLSTAVPLVMADQEIFLNSPFRTHELTQAKARVDRLGQDTPVKFVFILLDTGDEPNISTRSNDILEWSKQQVAAIMGSDYDTEAAKLMDSYVASMESQHDDDRDNVISFESALNEFLDEELELSCFT